METVSTDIAAAQRRLADLRAQLDREADRARTRRTVMVVVGIVLVLIVLGYLWWVKTQLDRVDAQTVVQLTVQQVEPYMQESPEQLATLLREQAPTVMRHAEQAMLQAPEMLAEQGKRLLVERMDRELANLQEGLYNELRDALDRVEQQAEAEGIDLNNPEQIQQQVPEIASRLVDEMENAIDNVYQDYQEIADRFVNHLDHLAEGTNLDQRERIQRQLIISFLAMMQKTIQTGETGVVGDLPRFRFQFIPRAQAGETGGEGDTAVEMGRPSRGAKPPDGGAGGAEDAAGERRRPGGPAGEGGAGRSANP